MDNITKKIKNNYMLVCIYIFWLLVAICVPFAGDDWEVSNWHNAGIDQTFFGMLKAWSSLSGRIFNNLGVSVLTYHRWLWNFLSAFIHTGTIYLISKLFTSKKSSKLILMSFIFYLCIGKNLRAETQFYITGNISYTICIYMIFYYISTIEKNKKEEIMPFFQNRFLSVGLWAFYCFITSLWIENLTIGFITYIIIELVLFGHSHDRKNYLKDILAGSLIGVSLGSLIMFSSVGIGNRINNSLTFIDTIKQNYFALIDHLVISNLNIYALCCLSILLAIKYGGLTICQRIFKTIYKILLFSIISIALFDNVVDSMANAWFNLGFVRNIQQSIHGNPIIAVIITIIVLGTLLIAILFSANKSIMLSLYISAFFSVAPIIMAPGARNMLFAICVVVCIGVYFMSTVQFELPDEKKCFWIFLFFILFLRMENYAFYLKDAFYVEQQRKAIIKSYAIKNINSNCATDYYLILPKHNDAFIGNANSTYYADSIINHYKLSPHTKVLFDDGFLVEKIEIKEDSSNIAKIYIQQVPRYGDDFTYYFSIYCDGSLIKTFNETFDKVVSIQLEKSGSYIVICTIKNNISNKTIDIKSDVYEIDVSY